MRVSATVGLVALLALVLGLVGVAPATAADPTHAVTVTVVTSGGAPVPKVEVLVWRADDDTLVRGRTAGDGTFVVPDATVGPWQTELSSYLAEPVSFDVVDEDVAVTLTLRGWQMVSGVVRDGVSGRGVKASVMGRALSGGEYFTTTTAADGSFRRLVEQGSYELSYRNAVTPGLRSYYPNVVDQDRAQRFVVAKGADPNLTLRVWAQPTISGKVRAGTSALRSARIKFVGSSAAVTTDGNGMYVAKVDPGSVVPFVEKDSGGKYFRTYLGGTVRRPDAVALDVRPGVQQTGIGIDVVRTTGVSGRVVDRAGRGLSGARVHVWSTTRAGAATTTANSGGYFSVRGLAAGPVRVVAVGSTQMSAQVPVTLSAGTQRTGLMVRATQDAGVWGYVRTTGSGVTTQDVSLFDSQRRWITTSRPDGDGVVGWGGLPGGTYYVSVDGSNLMRSVTVAEHGVATFGTLTRGRVVQVTGVVRSSGGKAVAGATVTVTDVYGTARTRVRTDSSGRYSVAGAVTGDYTVYVQPPASSTDALTTSALRVTGSTTLTKDVRLTRGSRLTGVVLGTGGRPAVDVQVATPDGRVTTTDAQGRWTLTGVRAGRIDVRFSDPEYVGGYRTAVRAVTARTGATVTVARITLT